MKAPATTIARQGVKGFTLVELIIVSIIIVVLASVAIPLAETAVKREREIELRRSLRLIRTALDDYQSFVTENNIPFTEKTYAYPEKLEMLVEGITYKDKENNTKIKKFLRRIPPDPMNPSGEWGLRSYQDKPDKSSWGGQNVWDVYSLSERRALDGTYYNEW